MIHILLSRLHQGHRTLPYPSEIPKLPPRFRGRPRLQAPACPTDCLKCIELCPNQALSFSSEGLVVDLGRCLFCLECSEACEKLEFTEDHRLAARKRESLILNLHKTLPVLEPLEEARLKLFRRSLNLRVVSAGGCNGCEVDVNVLGTLAWDLGRFGIQFVASPRHADGLLLCGPVTANMEEAVRKTYEAIPDPKLVIAVGACALSGGPFALQSEQRGGASSLLPVDLFIPGCPPHPVTILEGLLGLIQ